MHNNSENSRSRQLHLPGKTSAYGFPLQQNIKWETTGPIVTKFCTVCKQDKPVTEFHGDKQKADGLYPHCKTCNRINVKNRKRLRQHNPPPANGRCECCGQVKKLVLDHCHTTQEFRGWLCSDCNVAIGKLGDDTQGVLKALDYLERKNMMTSIDGGNHNETAA